MYSIFDPKTNEYVEIETKIKYPNKIALKLAKQELIDDKTLCDIIIKNNKTGREVKYRYEKKLTDPPKYISQENPDIYYTYETIPYVEEKNDKYCEKIDDHYIIKNKNIKKILDADMNELIIYEFRKNKLKEGRGRPFKKDTENNKEKFTKTRYYDMIPSKVFKVKYEYILL